MGMDGDTRPFAGLLQKLKGMWKAMRHVGAHRWAIVLASTLSAFFLAWFFTRSSLRLTTNIFAYGFGPGIYFECRLYMSHAA